MVSRTRSIRWVPVACVAGMVMLGIGIPFSKAQPPSDQPAASQPSMPAIDWQRGPTTARIGSVAQIEVPEGYQFTGMAGTQKIMELLQNPVSGQELGMIVPLAEDQDWFIIFEFNPIGYVKDDEKDKLDADAMLTSIRKGNDQANKERAKRGWAPMKIVGWERPPAYDPETNNLTWAIRGESEGEVVVNYNTRLLGRNGVMSANLVIDPAKLGATLSQFNSLLKGYSFQTGHKYSEYRPGDKVAKYGLAALITGGAAAVAVKAGLFKKLWKLIVLVVVGIGAFAKKLFGRGGNSDE